MHVQIKQRHFLQIPHSLLMVFTSDLNPLNAISVYVGTRKRRVSGAGLVHDLRCHTIMYILMK